MNFDWQNLVVLMAVAGAGGYLARLAWQSLARRKAAACGGCPSCPASAQEPQVVEIGSLAQNGQARDKT